MLEQTGMTQSNRPYTIVITGSIGTGKSAVAACLRNMGYLVADSDLIVHEGYKTAKELNELVISRFGSSIRCSDGSVDRHALGDIVFSNECARNDLNEIVHIYVVNMLMKAVSVSVNEPVFLDIPLMFEEKDKLKLMGLVYDEIWLVYTERQLQEKRLRERAAKEGKDPAAVLAVIDKQIDASKKISMSNEVIDNSGTFDDLNNRVKQLTNKLNIRK